MKKSNKKNGKGNEEKGSAFDRLPFKEQMKVMASRRRMDQLAKHEEESMRFCVDSAMGQIRLANTEDPEEAMRITVTLAEKYENRRPLYDGDVSGKNLAHRMDFARHALEKGGIDAMQNALSALWFAERGDERVARIFAKSVDLEDDEDFLALLEYWSDEDNRP